MKCALPTRVFIKEEGEYYNVYLDDDVKRSFPKEKQNSHVDAHFYAGDLAEEYDCMYRDEAEW